MKSFKVVAISDSRNSFGLRGVVLVARDGQTYEVGCNDLHLPSQGGVIDVPIRPGIGLNWAKLGFEIPRRLDPPAPPDIVRQVWSEEPTPLVPG